MLDIIRSEDRGSADYGWLKARQTFSFAEYHNPDRMGFGSLRVINEDRIEPGKGFDPHPHDNMEILTYIIEGALEHKDSMGNGSVIRPGDVQKMSAGTGVVHSEINHSAEEPVHLLQIWMLPGQRSLTPGYEQKYFAREKKLNQWRLLGSADGRNGSVTIHQDIDLYATVLDAGKTLEHRFAAGHKGYLHVVAGSLQVGDEILNTADGAAIESTELLAVTADSASEALLFDMA